MYAPAATHSTQANKKLWTAQVVLKNSNLATVHSNDKQEMPNKSHILWLFLCLD